MTLTGLLAFAATVAIAVAGYFLGYQDYLGGIDVRLVSETQAAEAGTPIAAAARYFRTGAVKDRSVYFPGTEDLAPGEMRVIACGSGMPVCEFPPDYVSRLWSALAEANPDFRRAYMANQSELSDPDP